MLDLGVKSFASLPRWGDQGRNHGRHRQGLARILMMSYPVNRRRRVFCFKKVL